MSLPKCMVKSFFWGGISGNESKNDSNYQTVILEGNLFYTLKWHDMTWNVMTLHKRTWSDMKGHDMKWIEVHSKIIIATGCCILKQIPVSCRWKPLHPGAFGTQSSAHVRSSEFGIWKIPYDFCSLEGPGSFLPPTVGCLVGWCFSCRCWQMEMCAGELWQLVFLLI